MKVWKGRKLAVTLFFSRIFKKLECFFLSISYNFLDRIILTNNNYQKLFPTVSLKTDFLKFSAIQKQSPNVSNVKREK